MKRNIILMTTCLLLAITTMAQPGNRRGSENGQMHARLVERLDLSEDQQTKLEDLRLEHLKNTSPVRSELKVKKAELDAAMTAQSIDQKTIDQLVETIGSLQNTLLKERVDHRLEVRAMLTEDQRVLFDQMRHKMHQRHGKGRRG